MGWIFVALLLTLSLILFGFRDRFSVAQSNLAGGSIRPGCVLAEAIAVLLLALFVLLVQISGWLAH